MRPEILYPLFAPVTSLPGVGARIGQVIEKLAGPHIVDLLWHLPTGIVDRRHRPMIVDAREGEIATIEVTIGLHVPSKSPRQPYRVHVNDATGEMQLVFFHAKESYLRRLLPEGERRHISGRVESYRGEPQMTHPDHIYTDRELAEAPLVEPVYPLSAGLSNRVLAKAAAAAVDRAPALAEWHPSSLMEREGWPAWQDAVRTVHAPDSAASLDPKSPARSRLAYDELLSNQLALALVRDRMTRAKGRPVKGDGRLREAVIAALPFRLTPSQLQSLSEIEGDMASPNRMLRLLQGDVGSGKTVVALIAMLNAIEAGFQAALMAPTEILARQHMESLRPMAEPAGLRIEILTGRAKGDARAQLLDRLAAGEIDILIGTHALFQDEIAFHRLGLAVVDEQHRFGVHQRLALSGKGGVGTDVLVMSATPIPRTLTLTAYGDMDVSRLTDKPPGRQPIDTRAVPLERLEDVIQGISRAISAGAQAYWVCPLVEESETVDAAAAESRFRDLEARFGDQVGLVHGRLKAAEKDEVMRRFEAGELRVLVATTVIEVGVNVPAATIMVIEHAERFGLAQLHQLRGRVGRGDARSSCVLLYQAPLSETATARLKVLRETEDGFRIAEEDLRLRGAGDILGTRQSGLADFRLIDHDAHRDLFAVAHDQARLILAQDRELEGENGRALRTLLYLFERDEAIRYLRAG